MQEVMFRLSLADTRAVPATIRHFRESSPAEMLRLGSNGDYIRLAKYGGDLYMIRPAEPPFFLLCHHLAPVHRVALSDLEALFAGCFHVSRNGNWYPCLMIGTDKNGSVCVVADDPEHTSGLRSRNTDYMWGSGAEMSRDQISGVRLWLSDPIDPGLFAGP